MWYIVRVESRKAAEVARELGGLYPCWKGWTKPSRKRKPVEVWDPVFPGWIFVPWDRYGQEKDVTGVRGVMKYGRLGPLRLSDADMDQVRRIAEFREEVDRSKVWRVGDSIELWGLVGVVVSVGDKTIRVDLGANFPVTVTL